MQRRAGSGLPFGTASSPKSITREWIGPDKGPPVPGTDGKSFFHDEKRNLESKLEQLSNHSLGYRCTNSDPAGVTPSSKEIIADPHEACVLQHTKLTGDESFISKLRLYALCAPHLEVGGWGNNGYVARVAGRTVLIAERKGTWLALAATVPSPVCRVATSGKATAGPTCRAIFKWIGSLIKPSTGTSRSQANWT